MRKTWFPQKLLLLGLALSVCLLTPGLAAKKPKPAPTPSPLSIPAQAQELDLSGLVLPPVAELSSQLAAVDGLSLVYLRNTNLTRDDMRALLQAFPGLTFDWTVQTNGLALSSMDEVIDFEDHKVTNGTDLLDALSCLPKLKTLHTYQSVLKRDVMAAMKEKYPDMEFGWTVTFAGTRRLRTDATVFSTMNKTTSKRYMTESFEVLKYCKNLKMLDLGHNFIRDISFLRELPQLKLLILADNAITDLSPLADLKELEYVELFKNPITNISPLSNLPHLLDLNLCFTKIKDNDVSGLLTNTAMERCWISHAGLSQQQQDQLTQGLPNCQFDFSAGHSTANRWREHGRYFVYRKGFLDGYYIPFDGTEQPPPPLE